LPGYPSTLLSFAEEGLDVGAELGVVLEQEAVARVVLYAPVEPSRQAAAP
jgi:hypothetical protein